MFLKCFDIVEMVTDSAAELFAPAFRENAAEKQKLRENCAVIDEYRKAFFCTGIDVELSMSTRSIKVRLRGLERKTVLPKLSGDDLRILVPESPAGDDIEIVFPGIWEPVREEE